MVVPVPVVEGVAVAVVDVVHVVVVRDGDVAAARAVLVVVVGVGGVLCGNHGVPPDASAIACDSGESHMWCSGDSGCAACLH